MGEKQLREYVEFLLRQCRIAGAYWFLGVEAKYGLDVTAKLNEEVWSKIGGLAAKEIKERFGITGEGIPAVIEALSYSPWFIITGFKIE